MYLVICPPAMSLNLIATGCRVLRTPGSIGLSPLTNPWIVKHLCSRLTIVSIPLPFVSKVLEKTQELTFQVPEPHLDGGVQFRVLRVEKKEKRLRNAQGIDSWVAPANHSQHRVQESPDSPEHFIRIFKQKLNMRCVRGIFSTNCRSNRWCWSQAGGSYR